jgi:hypothetical protein
MNIFSSEILQKGFPFVGHSGNMSNTIGNYSEVIDSPLRNLL